MNKEMMDKQTYTIYSKNFLCFFVGLLFLLMTLSIYFSIIPQLNKFSGAFSGFVWGWYFSFFFSFYPAFDIAKEWLKTKEHPFLCWFLVGMVGIFIGTLFALFFPIK